MAERLAIELLWFEGCPNHIAARRLLDAVLAELPEETRALVSLESVEVTDSAMAERLSFPGSPTIRVNGVDVDPADAASARYGMSCRVYETASGIAGLPERTTIEEAIRAAR